MRNITLVLFCLNIFHISIYSCYHKYKREKKKNYSFHNLKFSPCVGGVTKCMKRPSFQIYLFKLKTYLYMIYSIVIYKYLQTSRTLKAFSYQLHKH